MDTRNFVNGLARRLIRSFVDDQGRLTGRSTVLLKVFAVIQLIFLAFGLLSLVIRYEHWARWIFAGTVIGGCVAGIICVIVDDNGNLPP